MTRRPLSHPAHLYRGLGFILLLLLLAAGCTPAVGPGSQTESSPGLIPQVAAAPSLDEAQKLFNAAGGLDQPALEVPAASRRNISRSWTRWTRRCWARSPNPWK